MKSRCKICNGTRLETGMGGMQKTCSFCNGDGWVEIIDIIKKAECAENGKAEVVYGNKKKGRQDLR